MSDDDDGWELLVGPAHYQTNSEKNLYEFCNAAKNGDLEKVKEMLENKLIQNINSQSPSKKETVLHYACRNNNMEVLKFLIENGSDVNLKDVRGKHSLHLAVSNGFLEMVKYLIGKGADIHVIDKYNRSCVHWAAMNKHYNVVKELLNSGAHVYYAVSNNWQPLHEAVKSGDLEIVKLLIENKAEVNVNVPEGKSKPHTPLHIAARDGHVDCLNFLLDCKANVNVINQGKQTPLHEAAYRGSKECCRDLIIRGADPHAKNSQMRTPLLDACNKGHLQCAIYCLDAGSRVNHKDRVNDTALHHLFRTHGRFFLDDENDYRVRVQNNERLSVEKLVSFTDVLLQYGANPNLRNDQDETGYSLANTMQNKEVLELIIMATEKPRTLLHLSKIACRKIVRCDYKRIWNLPIPRTLKVYLSINNSYYSGW